MVVVGKPFAEILRIAADLHFSLIVMGIRGRHQGGIEENSSARRRRRCCAPRAFQSCAFLPEQGLRQTKERSNDALRIIE